MWSILASWVVAARNCFAAVVLAVLISPVAYGQSGATWETTWTDSDRKAVQESLIWSGHYFGVIDGQFGNLTRRAITEWQRENGYDTSGYLSVDEANALIDASSELRQQIGFTILSDPTTGISVGFPAQLLELTPRPLDQFGVEYLAHDGRASMTLSRFPCPDSACWDTVFASVRENLDQVVYDYQGDTQIAANGYSGDQYVVYFARRPSSTAAVFQLTMPRDDQLWLSIAMAIGTYIDPFSKNALRLVPLVPPSQ